MWQGGWGGRLLDFLLRFSRGQPLCTVQGSRSLTQPSETRFQCLAVCLCGPVVPCAKGSLASPFCAGLVGRQQRRGYTAYHCMMGGRHLLSARCVGGGGCFAHVRTRTDSQQAASDPMAFVYMQYMQSV